MGIYDKVLCIVCEANVSSSRFDIEVHRRAHLDREHGHGVVTLDSGRVGRLNTLEKELEEERHALKEWELRLENLETEIELRRLKEDRGQECPVCGERISEEGFEYQKHIDQHHSDALFGPCGYEALLNEKEEDLQEWANQLQQEREASSTVALEDIAEAWFPESWGDLYRPSSFQQTFADVYNTAFTLLVERQRKYGPENIEQLGLWGVFGRMGDDKVERLRRAFNGTIKGGKLDIMLGDEHSDESIDDTLMDIANYALILYALKHGLWGNPLEEDM